MIAIDNLAKAFGPRREVQAVKGVAFTAPDGEITGLLGPNGAGKTTLLRMLATLMIPDSGRATIDGHDIVRERYAVRRRFGVSPMRAGFSRAFPRAKTFATTVHCKALPETFSNPASTV